MIRVYAEAAFMAFLLALFVITGWHSFNVSEQAREDDTSINRYGED